MVVRSGTDSRAAPASPVARSATQDPAATDRSVLRIEIAARVICGRSTAFAKPPSAAAARNARSCASEVRASLAEWESGVIARHDLVAESPTRVDVASGYFSRGIGVAVPQCVDELAVLCQKDLGGPILA